MHIVNVTEVRRNIREILAEIARTKAPAVIVQRSKPVAYLVDADTFERMRQYDAVDILSQARRESLDRMLRLRARVARKTEARGDSVAVIRELRERLGRHE
ncbi:type II toxin-antitoxin system Phd/YefM family antitoxin [Neomoorella mulderi]|uniref:Antitoxin n=1 Tax=Moorella mulderi DSM 14980 TaxID=1122241 RepID=A0A151AU53_9FIRM|nr:type II toxin-antitoxin system Phd/YefM family antitoxin [Moorella mulderi]KYH31189.1 hypothetical protein MOMUL_25700 [Moorella mulderi DSM 14980]